MIPKNKHKTTGFTTPKNYFKCLEEGLLSKLYLLHLRKPTYYEKISSCCLSINLCLFS